MAKVLFRARDNAHGYELWVTDGSSGGTYFLRDINAGVGSSTPGHITALGNGKAVFEAFNTTYGDELWVTDGTPAGTTLLKDINPGSSNSLPSDIVLLASGKVLFSASDGSGTELWVTDGTPGGTQALGNQNPLFITPLGDGNALFSGYDSAHNRELWITNGTAAGTQLVKDIRIGTSGSFPYDITSLGAGKAVFGATDSKYGTQLWATDGSAAGTARLTNIVPKNILPDIKEITAIGIGKAVFSATNSTQGAELWVTDGTMPGTQLIADIRSGSSSSYPRYITALGNGQAVFQANDGSHGYELWVTNGTGGGGTSLLVDINPGSGNSVPKNFAALGNGKAVFSAVDGTHGAELWVTDGTAAGTTLLKDINPGAANSLPHNIAAIGGNQAMFAADDGTHGDELWVTDGTAAGTTLVADVNPGAGVSVPADITVLVPCFCRGTLIRTECGEVAVEALLVGDRVMTLSGRYKPIVWIGVGLSLVTRSNRLARPIIVRRGALADDVPTRDLYLTHGHGLYLDGVLIPVENLVNHRSVLWDEKARVVEYFHIELEDHDVLLAEGAPAESYHDAGNRAFFQNGRSSPQAGTPKPTVAPVLHCGHVVESVWSRLFDRAGGRIATEATDDPDLHLRIDGARLDPTATDDGVFAFTLDRPPAGRLCLCSRAGVPSLLGRGSDHRPLGVAIKQIILDQGGIPACFDYDLPQFREGGCYPPEDGFCWTDGEFELPARFFAGMTGPCSLTVRLQRHEMHYPIPAASASRDRAA